MKLLLLGLHFQGPIVFKMSLDEKNCIPCKIEKSARLRIGDSNVEFTSGCAIMEVSLPTNLPCKVNRLIVFLFTLCYCQVPRNMCEKAV